MRSTNPFHFIGTQNLSINTLRSYITDTCKHLNIKGDGPNQTVTPHCLHARMTALLIDAGYDDATVTLRTGHRSHESLQNYHNLRGEIGLNQLGNMFVSPEKRKGKIGMKHEKQCRGDVAVITDVSYSKKIKHDPNLPPCTKGEIENTFRGESGFVGGVLAGTISAPNSVWNVTIHRES